MSDRNPEYKFVSTAGGEYVDRLIAKYRSITGRVINPADPERLFLAWMADIIIGEKVNQNYIGNQNIPSRAEGENLDSLGEFIYFTARNGKKPSSCTMRFHLSVPAPEIVVIPAGTRVTDEEKALVWATVSEVIIPEGVQYADSLVVCETTGNVGNGYIPGQINKLIDVDKILYNTSCENIDTTYGGADTESDDEYFERMRQSLEALSVAGPSGAYEYHAMNVSKDITDVKAVRPRRTRTVTLDVYSNSIGEKAVFLGGDWFIPESLSVAGAKIGTDYTYTYENSLLKIDLVPDGLLSSKATVDISVKEDMASCVYIYALCRDGNIADTDLKNRILAACSDREVRPLADFVSVEDAQAVTYGIDFDYYIADNAEYSFAQIRDNINTAVASYITWQKGKFGRDINPSYLHDLLMHTGVKRVVIRSPEYRKVNSGRDGTIPQYAVFSGDMTTCGTFGGYEDE